MGEAARKFEGTAVSEGRGAQAVSCQRPRIEIVSQNFGASVSAYVAGEARFCATSCTVEEALGRLVKDRFCHLLSPKEQNAPDHSLGAKVLCDSKICGTEIELSFLNVDALA